MSDKLPLSVSMLTFNSERTIALVLDSIKDIASEIIIIDSHSTDNTLQIVNQYGAKVFDEDWKGFTSQKNSALDKCTQQWVLMLDSDEEVTPELKQSIITAVNNPKFSGYYMNRITMYLGQLLKYSWQPEWRLFLMNRDMEFKWAGSEPHSFVQFSGSKGKLDGDLIHHSFIDLKHHFTKIVDYSFQSAQSYHNSGKKFSILNLILNPSIAFIKTFFFRMGFLDGIRGLLASISVFVSVFLKYAMLWELEKVDNKRN